MKNYLAMAAIAVAASAFAVKADAMPIGSGLGHAADQLGAIEQAQYFYGGRNYCWYDDGWRGEGFYWCGYNLRQGLGWGGGVGFRGWSHRGGGGRHMHGGGGGGHRMGGGGGRGGPRMGGGGGGAQRMMGGGGRQGGGMRGGGNRGGGGGGGKKH
jgi:hypothetical protein